MQDSSSKDEPEIKPPLSWKEARSRLLELLHDYMRLHPPVSRYQHPVVAHSSKKQALLSWFLRHDLDLKLAFLASLALLILACVSLSAKGNDDSEDGNDLGAEAGIRVYHSQVVASCLLLSSTLFSMWIMRRRRCSCSEDLQKAKRVEIAKFLNAFEAEAGSFKDDDDGDGNDNRFKRYDLPEGPKLAGTALTDVYPVYRKGGRQMVGSWIRIPSLLLVEGDYVALQVGDTAPGNCRSVDSRERISMASGERLSLTGLQNVASALNTLPRGRSTLPRNSDKLLTVCNGMGVFIMEESPLRAFLQQSRVDENKPAIVSRQITAIRLVCCGMAVLIFVATFFILFVRPDVTSMDLSLVLPLPFLGALGLLPVIGPTFLCFLEVLGTARIMTAVHVISSERDEEYSPSGKRKLLWKYILATLSARLSLPKPFRPSSIHGKGGRQSTPKEGGTAGSKSMPLVQVPRASTHLLEKLGVATAFTLVDDELACEPYAIPQQLLIPSGEGLKLLDLCPTYGEDSHHSGYHGESIKKRGSFNSLQDDSDSDAEASQNFITSSSRRRFSRALRARYKRRGGSKKSSLSSCAGLDEPVSMEHEVQFEDPLWWQHLPSLKCIGLACLLTNDETGSANRKVLESNRRPSNSKEATGSTTGGSSQEDTKSAREKLVDNICADRRSHQLSLLAHCIGFSTEANMFGERGDASPFTERLRLQVISTALLRERLEIDAHERGSEDSRWWGLLRPDSTSVIVEDDRSSAYQLLTVGDARIVTSLCNEAWQGEISTILPLTAADRATILDTSRSWRLADLDVAAFSYSPVPHTLEKRLGGAKRPSSKVYLLEKTQQGEQLPPISKDKSMSEEWSLVSNQIFLGVLGSSVIPRNEIQKLLSVLGDAGVRFVYFSPRNMRRQKELASQMGIDVAWNCAISLRPLDEGEDDPHRMVSTYADWDVNAKLPHGIDNVRKHLEEVDNVPLLVSLFTDVTKETTMQMLETFQEYSDTVIAIGLSHLPRNSGIFATADLSVGIDVLTENVEQIQQGPEMRNPRYNNVLPSEVVFVSAISAHACAFRLRGATALSHLPTIIEQGRGALEAATAAAYFMVSGSLSFAVFALLTACTVSKAVPFVPILGSVLYLVLVLPILGLSMAMSDVDEESMDRVPPKNDRTVTFGRKDGRILFAITLLKALPPAVLPQLLYLIAYGELLIKFDPNFVEANCSPGLGQGDWVSLVRCDALAGYDSDAARVSAGVLVLAELVLCSTVTSAGFVHRTVALLDETPWNRNHHWIYAVVLCLALVAFYLAVALEGGALVALPWYYFVLAVAMPFICLAWHETLKRVEIKHERRAEKLRRLQFETRLGMWSPK